MKELSPDKFGTPSLNGIFTNEKSIEDEILKYEQTLTANNE